MAKGVSGNREGYKLYCFNTSIRPPEKNIEFLRIFKKYEGKLCTDVIRIEMYKEAIQTGTLIPNKIKKESKEKIGRGERLTEEEMMKVLTENCPKNGFTGRIGDYIMTLENQALIQRLGTSRKYRIRLTELGNELLKNDVDELDIYTKAMIGLEYGSPIRDNVKNKSNPFLNTLFCIDYLKKYYKNKKTEFKGITLYELSIFILTMKHCNYKSICEKIIQYRKKYQTKENKQYARTYLEKNEIQAYEDGTLFGSASYADEVMRKFKKTGLLSEKRSFKTRYINFNQHELGKIELLLEEYKDYKWKKYHDADDYYEYIEHLMLPWENQSSNYYRILKDKAKKIHYELKTRKITKKDYDEINRKYYQYVFEQQDYSQFPYEKIICELNLINRTIDGTSSLSDIEEYVRLEWFTTLLFAHKFGKEKLKSNLVLNDDGLPLSQAPGKHADIEMIDDSVIYNIEVTTIRNRTQQLNSETTTVARHLASNNQKGKVTKALLIAPYIHEDTIRYYRYEAATSNVTILPISIGMMIKLVEKSQNMKEFDEYIECYCKQMKQEPVQNFEQLINHFEEEQI